jgi:hypothetical protein
MPSWPFAAREISASPTPAPQRQQRLDLFSSATQVPNRKFPLATPQAKILHCTVLYCRNPTLVLDLQCAWPPLWCGRFAVAYSSVLDPLNLTEYSLSLYYSRPSRACEPRCASPLFTVHMVFRSGLAPRVVQAG